MISKAKIKYIKSLQHKKIRNSEGVFVAEGHKVVGDLLTNYRAKIIVATSEWIKANDSINSDEIIEVTEDELSRVSFLQPKIYIVKITASAIAGIHVFLNILRILRFIKLNAAFTHP